MLKFISLSKENLKIAQEIQKKIFPEEYMNETLENSLTSASDYSSQFWLVKKNKRFIGLTGIYFYPEHPKDAWLNWFGVIPEYRRKGYGRKIFYRTYAWVRRLGFDAFRLYTDAEDNDATLAFYRSLRMREETYHPKDDDFTNILIFSKKCHPFGKKVTSWNHKYLDIQKQLLLSQNDMLACVRNKTMLSLHIFMHHPAILRRFLRLLLYRLKNTLTSRSARG